MLPSLVICPIRITGTPVSFANLRSWAAVSFICEMEPGEDSTFCENIVCTESTIIRSGIIPRASARMFSIRVSLYIRQLLSVPPILAALSLTCLALSSPVT